MTIQLHCFGESGNSYKAALALELSGLDWEPVFVDFFNGAARTDDYRALNPMSATKRCAGRSGTITSSVRCVGSRGF